MINLYKLKFESKVQHDKTNSMILKQFTNKFNDLHEEKVWESRSWEWYKLEEGTWSMDIEMEHFIIHK